MPVQDYDKITPFHISLITPRGHVGEYSYRELHAYTAALRDFVARGWQIVDTIRGFNPDWAVTVIYGAVATQ